MALFLHRALKEYACKPPIDEFTDVDPPQTIILHRGQARSHKTCAKQGSHSSSAQLYASPLKVAFRLMSRSLK